MVGGGQTLARIFISPMLKSQDGWDIFRKEVQLEEQIFLRPSPVVLDGK